MFGLPSKQRNRPLSVLITGSSRGIGLAAARRFLSAGDRVGIFCRHRNHVDAAVKELGQTKSSSNFFATTGDVSSSRDVERIVKETIGAFGGIDVLINNAGLGLYKAVEDTSESEWEEILDINLKGYFLFIKSVLPYMQQQKDGVIVNMSSGLGVSTEAKYSAYSASKFGIMALTQAVSDELKNKHIKVYAVMPGGVATKLHLDMHPWENPKTMMQPEYIGEKIYWLVKSGKPSGYQMAIYS